MNPKSIHRPDLSRGNLAAIAANRAEMREIRRQRDRQELEREWRYMTATPAPHMRCTGCAALAQGTRCAVCLIAAALPGLRP
jgi:hypothetical protein